MESTEKKPRVIGLVVILVLRSLLTLFIAYTGIQEINVAPELYESWGLPLQYFVIAIGVLLLIAAILIARYKRLGLMIGAGAILVDVVLALIFFISGSGSNPVGLAVSALILYYIFKYLRNEPEKSFFT